MSIFGWLFSKPNASQNSVMPSEREDEPAQGSGPAFAKTDVMVDLKYQRHERREHLYEVVRGVLLRSEVLASHYKFKVLSLDNQGRQFLVMIDLLDEHALPAARWAHVEQLLAMTAAQRYDLQVKSVYWRMMMPAFGAPERDLFAPVASQVSPVSRPAPMAASLAAQAAAARAPNYDPIQQDEMLAFKKAVADNSPEEEALPTPGHVVTSGPRRPKAATGYEDTQLLVGTEEAVSPLSRTQFGGLD